MDPITIKYILDFPFGSDSTVCGSSNGGIFWSLDTAIELQVGVHDEFDYFTSLLGSYNDEFVPIDSIIAFGFDLPHEFDIIDYRSSCLSALETSLVDFALVMNIVENIELIGNIHTKVTHIYHIFLFIFFRHNHGIVVSWIHDFKID